jgi:hypothetical protein
MLSTVAPCVQELFVYVVMVPPHEALQLHVEQDRESASVW